MQTDCIRKLSAWFYVCMCGSANNTTKYTCNPKYYDTSLSLGTQIERILLSLRYVLALSRRHKFRITESWSRYYLAFVR